MTQSIHRQLLPREHGAWAMLLIPYSIGVAVNGGLSTRTALGAVGVLLLFLSRQPLMTLLKRPRYNGRPGLGDRERWWCFGVLATSGLGVFFWLLIRYGLWHLLIIGWVALTLFLVHSWYTLRKKERTIWGELVGVLLLTFTASLAAYLAQEQLTHQTFTLWALNALYFSTSIFYIKMRVKASSLRSGEVKLMLAKNCLAYLTILILVVAILTFANWVPILVPLAFVPMIVHTVWGIIASPPKLRIMKEGVIQTGLALMFAVLVIISYKL